MIIDGWVIERKVPIWSFLDYPGLPKGESSWIAQSPDDERVSVMIKDGVMHLVDDIDYYPSGGYSVPLAVVAKLQELGE